MNGGAQLRAESEAFVSRELASKLEADYHSLPLEHEENINPFYVQIGQEESGLYERIFYTSFHAVEKSTGLLGSNVRW